MCKAIIIGGGISGLTAAIALEQAGLEAHVYERVAELREAGAGISLWANAVRALKVLGLADSLSAHGWSPLRGTLRTSTGEILMSSQSHHTADAGVTVGALHRADLLRLLREAVDDARVHVGRECVRVSSDHGAVTVHFADGSAAAGDVLIGADGLHSVVRAAVHTTAPPRYAGFTAWRGVVEFTTPAAASESWGRGQRFGIVPLNDGRVYWFATKNAPEHDRDPVGTVKTRLIDRFHGWHTPIEALLDATPESAILRNDIYDRDPDGPWTADRVTLLGVRRSRTPSSWRPVLPSPSTSRLHCIGIRPVDCREPAESCCCPDGLDSSRSGNSRLRAGFGPRRYARRRAG